MSQIDRESISALLDNEADDLELRRFLKASEQDPSLLETWERFSLAQSALHEPVQIVGSSLSQRIAAQLEQEAPLSATVPAAEGQSSWRDGLTKMAIAASVAAVFMVTVQTNLDNSPAAPMVADQVSETPQIEPATNVTLLADTPSGDAPVALDTRHLRQLIDRLTLDEEEPVLNEQIQDSPLYRLVNEYQAKP